MISDDTFNVSALAHEYPPGSIESRLLEIMSKSDARYHYDSPGELKFELQFRKAVVDSAISLHRSGMDFEVFHKSRCNEAYWHRRSDGGFSLREDAAPSEAIADIFSNGREYGTECATAMVIVYYGAALDVFGARRFDRLFTHIELMNWHNIDPLLQGIGNPDNVADMLYGDRVYFMNPDVDPKEPEWRGENVIVLPDGLYYGHGVGISTVSGVIAALNNKRVRNAGRSAYFLDIAARPDFGKLYRVSERTAEHTAPLIWGPFPAPVVRGIS